MSSPEPREGASPPPFDLQLAAPEAIPGVRVLPVVHERVDFAPVVRGVLDALDPAVVGVELPTPLSEVVGRAIDRLPKISLVLSRHSGEEALIWVVAPGDPLAEALRWARERGRQGVLIDPDVPYAERHQDPVPDPHALWSLGAGAYLDLLRRATATGEVSEADALREAGMAHRLQRLRRELDQAGDSRPIVAVVGAAHSARLMERLGQPTAAAFARPRRQELTLRHLAAESLAGLMTDYPLLHAAWENLRPAASPRPDAELAKGDPVVSAAEEEELLATSVSRPESMMRFGLRVISGGASGDAAPARRRALGKVFARRGARHHASPDGEGMALAGIDRQAAAVLLWQVASRSYRAQTQERPGPWQRRLFLDFGRRYARQRGRLVGDLFEWVVAARGVADDNLAWELYDAARAYPWQHGEQEIEVARVDGEELDLGTHKVRFRRRFLRSKSRPLPVGLQRGETSDPSSWLRAFDGDSLCSYPKEDVVVEDYAHYLQRKAISILTSENRRVEPFSTSLLDGIDLRETLRNAHLGGLWVQELGRTPGGAGSVVVIFDEDEANSYPYRMTWHGEHEQESDMAFYSTMPHEQVVGPGILRATYGGFLMTYPPGRLWDVWEDREYQSLPAKAEVLLAAGIDYSMEPLVVHVARQPPSSRSKQRAALLGKRIVHIPLASLSPVALRRLRVVHLLSGHDKRSVASRYIW